MKCLGTRLNSKADNTAVLSSVQLCSNVRYNLLQCKSGRVAEEMAHFTIGAQVSMKYSTRVDGAQCNSVVCLELTRAK